jgi:preprotein translocase SecE subunit
MAENSARKSVSKPKGPSPFARLGRFLKESYIETWHKSSWPTAPELRQFTIVVIFAIAVVTLWIGGIDMVLSKITQQWASHSYR